MHVHHEKEVERRYVSQEIEKKHTELYSRMNQAMLRALFALMVTILLDQTDGLLYQVESDQHK